MLRISAFVVVLTCGVLVGAAVSAQSGEASTETLAPTPLEAFAAADGARTVWSSFIGELAGPDARVVVTAIVVRNDGARPTTRRGLRLDLVHLRPEPNCDLPYVSWSVLCKRPNAALYFEDARLPEVQAELAANRPIDGALVTSYGWRGQGASGGGVIAGGYSLEGHTLAELGALVAQGLGELGRAPR